MTRPWREQDSTKRAKTDPNFAKFVGLGNPAEEDALHKINEAYAISLNLLRSAGGGRTLANPRKCVRGEQCRKDCQEPRRLDGPGKQRSTQPTRDIFANLSCCSQVTTAWVLAQPQVTAPIIGVSLARRRRDLSRSSLLRCISLPLFH